MAAMQTTKVVAQKTKPAGPKPKTAGPTPTTVESKPKTAESKHKPSDQKPKPRLKNLDDLFSLNGDVNPLEKTTPIIEMQPSSKRAVYFIEIEKLTPFRSYPFLPYEGERLDDMVESIKKNGVLVPIIVRRVGSILEILSGHNRVNAGKIAGLKEIPTLVLDNISDDDAMVYVIETNLIQRSFSDMAHSEKAAVIALHHSKLFSQGKRSDILKQLSVLEKPHEYKDDVTCSQVANKKKTITKIGQEYGMSKDTVARYLRVSQLIPALKSNLDIGNTAFIPSVTLSFLKEAEQELVAECMERSGLSVNMKKAVMFRKLSNKGKLDKESVYRILSGSMEQKPNRTPTVKIDKGLYARYFKPNQPAKEVQEIVAEALVMYFERK